MKKLRPLGKDHLLAAYVSMFNKTQRPSQGPRGPPDLPRPPLQPPFLASSSSFCLLQPRGPFWSLNTAELLPAPGPLHLLCSLPGTPFPQGWLTPPHRRGLSSNVTCSKRPSLSPLTHVAHVPSPRKSCFRTTLFYA